MKEFVHIRDFIIAVDEIINVTLELKAVYIHMKDGNCLIASTDCTVMADSIYNKAINDLTTPKAVY